MISLSYGYTVTYKNGWERTLGGSQWMVISIQDDEHLKIVEGIAAGLDLMDIPGIDPILEQMRQDVIWDDSWHNTNGTKRKKQAEKASGVPENRNVPGAENNPSYQKHEESRGRNEQTGAENDDLSVRWLLCYDLLQKRESSLQ